MTNGAPAPRGRIGDSIRTLIFRPGELTRARVEGGGRAYVRVEWLLLVFAAAYLALVFVQTRGPSVPSPDVASLCVSPGGPGSGLQALVGGAAGNATPSPAAARLLALAGRALCDPAPFTRAFAFAVPVAFLLLIPLFAALMRMAFREQMPAFRDNWCYAVESHAALFALLTALAAESFVGSWLLGLLCSLGGLVYASWNLLAGARVAYAVSAREARRKTTLVGVGYAVCLVGAVWAIMWAMLARTLA